MDVSKKDARTAIRLAAEAPTLASVQSVSMYTKYNIRVPLSMAHLYALCHPGTHVMNLLIRVDDGDVIREHACVYDAVRHGFDVMSHDIIPFVDDVRLGVHVKNSEGYVLDCYKQHMAQRETSDMTTADDLIQYLMTHYSYIMYCRNFAKGSKAPCAFQRDRMRAGREVCVALYAWLDELAREFPERPELRYNSHETNMKIICT